MSEWARNRSSIEVSSTTRACASSGCSSLKRNCIVPGSKASRRWIVLASCPAISASRCAARPVGAASRMDLPIAFHNATTVRVVKVLPHPGPPVSTSSREEAASSTAWRCSSESVMPRFCVYLSIQRWTRDRSTTTGLLTKAESRVARACSVW